MAEAIQDAEVVDATPVEETPQQASPPAAELVRRERRSEVLRPLDVTQLVESFHQYQDMLPQLLEGSDWQDAGRDSRTGQPRKFVKKSGWRKIATAFDLDVVIIHEEVERDPDGHPLRAKVIARAIAPSGRMMDGDGYCAIEERTFSKPENDLRATATTRAKNRAISDLVGMGDVSAEEVDGNDQRQRQQGPPFGPPMPPEMAAAASSAATRLCGTETLARALWARLKEQAGGYMPQIVADTLVTLANTAREPDPVHVDPSGDIPTEEQAQAELAGLQDVALEVWSQLQTDAAALKRVNEVAGNRTALLALISTGREALVKRDAGTKAVSA